MADPIHIQAPDGSTVEFPAGTSDDVIKGVMAKEYGAPKQEKGVLGKIDDYVRAAANGMTFGLADRFAAGMGAATGIGGKSGDYAGNLADERAKTGAFEAEHPIASTVTNIAGGAAVPIGAFGAAAKGVGLGMKVLRGSGAGAALGGIGGAASAPDWTDPGQTAVSTAKGVGLGAALGGSLPLAGKAIGSGYNAIADALVKPEGMSRAASRHLIEALNADNPQAVRGQIDRLGPDAMLADTGPAMLGKAQGAALNSDEGRSVLAGALTARNEGTNQRIMGDVERALGPAEDPQTVSNAIRARRSEVDSRAYPAALGSAPDVQTAHILTYLDYAIPQSVGMEKKALTSARNMLVKTERQPRMDPDAPGRQAVDARGNPIFDEVKVSQNDANVLHKVKGELDNVIQYDAPGLDVPAGAVSRQQAALKQLRHELNSTLEDQVPGYAEANRQSAALAKRGEAVEAGTQYLGSGKTTPSPDRFAAEFDPLSQGEKIAFAKGSRGNIERVLGTKANDLQALRSELQGEGGWNTAKIATVHGQDAADELAASVDRNLKFRDTHNKVVENSQTAQRQAAAKGMKPEPSNEIPFFNPGSTVTGMTATAGKKVVNLIANALRPDPTKSFGEVARILSAQGGQRDQHLAALIDALSRRQSNAAVASKVGDRAALVAALLGNGYVQSGPRQSQSQ
jgi:hypothetical protein